VAKPAPRPVLAKAANAGTHPAAPVVAASRPAETRSLAEPLAEPLVMFSVRIPRSLRQAVKMAAVEQGTTIEAWVEQALRATLAKPSA
jgi:hypothetical protein